MEGTERREQLVKLLLESNTAISGSQLSKLLGVSRQVIVQDIALLRASDIEIISTTKGYIVKQESHGRVRRTFYVKHDNAQIEDELCTIVDEGGKVLDVQVAHPIYGAITTGLVISNRAEVYEFVKQVNQKKTTPLKELTNGEHSHTIEADSEEVLNRIEGALKAKKYLIQE